MEIIGELAAYKITVEYSWKITFCTSQLRKQFVGEVGKFIIFRCQVSLRCCVPKNY